MTSMCKAYITNKNEKKSRRCKKSASSSGFCSTHKKKQILLSNSMSDLNAAESLVTLSQSTQSQQEHDYQSTQAQQEHDYNADCDYTHSFSNYKDTIKSMEREFTNSMEYLNVQLHELKSHLTLTELEKMDVLCTSYFEKYEDYGMSLKNDIKNQLEYYEKMVESLYEDEKILESNMKYRKDQSAEMNKLIQDAKERLVYLHDLLTL